MGSWVKSGVVCEHCGFFWVAIYVIPETNLECKCGKKTPAPITKYFTEVYGKRMSLVEAAKYLGMQVPDAKKMYRKWKAICHPSNLAECWVALRERVSAICWKLYA